MASQISAKEKRRKYTALLKRDGDKCFWCGDQFQTDNPYTLDHLITQKDGGANALINLVLSCNFCNNKRKATPAGEFMAWLRANHTDGTYSRYTTFQHVESAMNRTTPANLEGNDELNED